MNSIGLLYSNPIKRSEGRGPEGLTYRKGDDDDDEE